MAARSVIGLVTVGSIWDNALFRRSALNRSNLVSELTEENGAFRQQIQLLVRRFTQAGFDDQHAQAAADQVIYQKVEAQAMLLADKDLFTSLLLLATAVAFAFPSCAPWRCTMSDRTTRIHCYDASLKIKA